MSDANKVLIQRWFEEVWNKKRPEAIREMMHPEAIVRGVSDNPSEVLRGPEAFARFWQKFVSAFPNVRIKVEAVIAEGDQVVARCSVKGRHSGDGLGVKATGVEIDFTGITIGRVKHGQLIEGWNNFDFLRLYKQIGLVRMAG